MGPDDAVVSTPRREDWGVTGDDPLERVASTVQQCATEMSQSFEGATVAADRRERCDERRTLLGK
jgi:hypothetical protein